MFTTVHRRFGALVFSLLIAFSMLTVPLFGAVRRAKEPIAGRYIVLFTDRVTDVDAAANDVAHRYDAALLSVWKEAVRGAYLQMKDSDAIRMSSDARVASVEEDAIVGDSEHRRTGEGTIDETTINPQDPLWHLTQIANREPAAQLVGNAAKQRYPLRYTGRSVKVYLIDSGVVQVSDDTSRTNPFNPTSFLNSIGGDSANQPVSQRLPTNAEVVDPIPLVTDSEQSPCGEQHAIQALTGPPFGLAVHGTAVAGFLAGRDTGVARDAQVVPVKVVSCRDGVAYRSVAALISAFEWVKAHAERPAVISVSHFVLTESPTSPCEPLQVAAGCVGGKELIALERAVRNVLNDGIPVVTAANNHANDACKTSPARLSRRARRKAGGTVDSSGVIISGSPIPGVISVGGVDWAQAKWSGSNYGQCVDIWAPAALLTPVEASWVVDSVTQRPRAYITPNEPGRLSGTSYAAPMVAGVIARMMEEDQGLVGTTAEAIDRIWERLEANATILPDRPGGDPSSPNLLLYHAGVTFRTKPVITWNSSTPTISVEVVGDSDVNDADYLYKWYRVGSGVPVAMTRTFQAEPGSEYWVEVVHPEPDHDDYSAVSNHITVPAADLRVVKQPDTQWVVGTGVATLIAEIHSSNTTYTSQWLHYAGEPPAANETTRDGDTHTLMRIPTQAVETFALQATCSGCAASITSDSAQIRRCIPVNTPTVGDRGTSKYDAWAQAPASSEIAVSNAQDGVSYLWEYRNNSLGLAPGPFVNSAAPEQFRYWHERHTRFLPPKPGLYSVRASNGCSERRSAEVEITEACFHRLYRSFVDGQASFLNSNLRREEFVARGRSVILGIEILTTSPRALRVRWSTTGAGNTVDLPPQVLPITSTFATPSVQVPMEVTAEIIDTESGCSRTVVFALTPQGPGCDVSSFRAWVGLCPSGVVPTPFVGRPNTRVSLNAFVYDTTTGAELTVAQMENLRFEWSWFDGTSVHTNTNRSFDLVVENSLDIALNIKTASGPAACSSVPVRLVTRGERCDPMCVQLCRFSRLREHGVPRTSIIIAPGQSITIQPPDDTSAFSYDWYSVAGSGPAELFAHTPTVVVSPVVDTRYWLVRDGVQSDPLDVYIHTPLPAVAASPRTQVLTAGSEAHVEAVITPAPESYAGYTFEWHLGNDPADATAPVIGTSRLLSRPDLQDDENYWCKVIYPNGDTAVTNVATVAVTCTSAIDGIINAWPSLYVSRLDRPFLYATAYGKRLTYEWYQHLPNQPNQPFVGVGRSAWITPSHPLTSYSAVITDSCGTTAALAEVDVHLCLPTIDSEPADVLVADGASATLTLGTSPAFAGQTVNVNWYDGTDAYEQNSLEDEPAFFTPAIAGGTAKTYYATATSNCGTDTTPYMRGVRSRLVTVRACKNPGITAVAATPAQVRSGGSVTLAVAVTGSDLTYQWYRGNPGDTSAPIATGSAAAVTATTTTTYWVRVTSEGLCSTNSGAVGVDVCTDPVITVQPQSIAIRSGQSTTLSVTSTTPGVTYQWHNATTGAAISTATNSTLTVDPAADAQYYVIVKRGACSVQSATVTVTVCSLSAGITGAQNTTYQQWVTLTATPLNARVPSANAHYTWYQGTGANSSVLNSGTGMTQRSVNPANTTPYWVRINDGTCTFDSEPVTVSVCIPQITIQPQGTLIQPSQTAILSVTTTNIVGRTFRWYIGAPGDISQPAPGASATTSTYTTPALASTTSYWVRVSTSCTTVDSSAAVISVCQPAAISSITPTRSIRQGASTWHQVYATGSNLTYQWYTGTPGNTGNPITGATLASISVAPTATTTYWARVWTDGLCTKDSGAMVVDVCTDPAITTEPASTTIASGQATTLTVVTSTTGVTYQWYSGVATVINGATGPSLTVSPTTDTNYYCTITRNACSINSATVSVKVCTLGGSLTGGANSAAGQAVLLTATPINPRVSADAATYTWYAGTGANATVFNSGVGMKQRSVTPGATTDYWVRINDGTCTADSNVTRVTVCIPTITAQPQGSSINSGQSATLSVSATGGGLTYRWYMGNPGDTSQPVNNGTNATISVTPAATTTYWARVTGCTTADSMAATINVCIPPSVSGPFESGMRTSGGQASVWVTASGTGLSYQWYVGQSGDTSQPIAGANTSTWQFAAQFSLYYWVRVTGTCGTVNSAAVLHSVNPVITQQPAGTTVPSGTTASLGITATGTSLTYQWYRGNNGDVANPMNGATATTPSFMTPAVTTATNYWCKVTSAQAAVNSNHATVSVCTGPAINFIYTQYNNWNYWTITVSVATVDTSRGVRYYWYTGVPGNVGQSVFKYEANATIQVLASSQQTWWCRVWYSDNSCYTDTSGATISPMQ